MSVAQPEHNGGRDGATRPDDGGDVARDPDAIAREIEQTRAELADTIDAIADRLSPKRAAARGTKAVKAQVSSVLQHANGEASGGPLLAESGPNPQRRLRSDRVLLVIGAGAVVVGAVVFWRTRHR
jgi:hypothetical protein